MPLVKEAKSGYINKNNIPIATSIFFSARLDSGHRGRRELLSMKNNLRHIRCIIYYRRADASIEHLNFNPIFFTMVFAVASSPTLPVYQLLLPPCHPSPTLIRKQRITLSISSAGGSTLSRISTGAIQNVSKICTQGVVRR